MVESYRHTPIAIDSHEPMGRLVCIANWSEGRNNETVHALREALTWHPVSVHYAEGDWDHNRTVTAFSGEMQHVAEALMNLCDLAFARIDMRSHRGVHPRIGALDVCPFVILQDSVPVHEAKAFVADIAEKISKEYKLPIFLYELSETGRHAADLPSLRKGQYEGLFERRLQPDFGPAHPNPKLGASVFGLRDWLIAMNLNLAAWTTAEAVKIAAIIRSMRTADPRFAGVRALGFPLKSRGISQVSMNLTMPDKTPVDPIIDWVKDLASDLGTKVSETELVGVIHRRHVRTATQLAFVGSQILE